MKHKLLNHFILHAVAFLMYAMASAQLSGGQISLDTTQLRTSETVCSSTTPCVYPTPTCVMRAYNFTAPSGGSGHYRYAWQRRDGSGPWTDIPFSDTISPIALRGPLSIYVGSISYRRVVKDSANPTLIGSSNTITLNSFGYNHGLLTFANGREEVYVPVGVQPPQVRSSGSTNCPEPYIYYEYKINNGNWLTLGSVAAGMGMGIDPPIRTTPDTVYVRSYITGRCGDYDTTYSRIATIYFYNAVPFNPGTIATSLDTACAGRIIHLTGTPTNANQAYPAFQYVWQVSNDNVSWTEVFYYGSGRHYTDSNFAATKFYRRAVEPFPGSGVYTYSNVVKVTKATTGCSSFTPGVIYANTPTCDVVHLSGTPATSPKPVTYKWQYSIDSFRWVDKSSGPECYDSAYTLGTYYRRVAYSDSNIQRSNVVRLTTYPIASGVPDSVGRGKWYYACHKASGFFGELTFKGYYISDSADINTAHQWAPNTSPSFAMGYSGCPIDSNSSYRMIIQKKGFRPGRYVVNTLSAPGLTEIRKNDSTMAFFYAHDSAATYPVGQVDSATTIKVECRKDFVNKPLQLKFIRIGSRPAEYRDSACHTYTSLSYLSFYEVVDTAGSLVATVNEGAGTNLGILTVRLKQSAPGASNIPISANGIRYMPRHFVFTSGQYGQTQFPNPVTVRLYFLNSELNAFRNALNLPAINLSDLRITHYDGPNEDCDRNNNTSIGQILVPSGFGFMGSDAFYLDVQVSSFSEFGVIHRGSVVPLQWVFAKAERRDEGVLLQWKVANEVNNDYFEVMRSYNSVDFEPVAKIVDDGSIASGEYSYMDKQPGNGVLYYAIRQTDKDGKTTLSRVMKVNAPGDKMVTLFPNPTTDVAVVKAAGIIRELEVCDASGRRLMMQQPGRNNARVSTAHLGKGIYLVRLLLFDGTVKVVKMTKE